MEVVALETILDAHRADVVGVDIEIEIGKLVAVPFGCDPQTSSIVVRK